MKLDQDIDNQLAQGVVIGAVTADSSTQTRIALRTPAERRRAQRRASLRRYGIVLAMLSPWIVGFCLFTAGPMVISFYYSFTHYDLTSSPKWIGLDNYLFMFQHATIDGRPDQGDPMVWQAVKNTALDHRRSRCRCGSCSRSGRRCC